jgi:hypothetical protein
MSAALVDAEIPAATPASPGPLSCLPRPYACATADHRLVFGRHLRLIGVPPGRPWEIELLVGLGRGLARDGGENVEREYAPKAVCDRRCGVARVLVEVDDRAR